MQIEREQQQRQEEAQVNHLPSLLGILLVL